MLRKVPQLPPKIVTGRKNEEATGRKNIERKKKEEKEEEESISTPSTSSSTPSQQKGNQERNSQADGRGTKILINKFEKLENSTKARHNLKISGGKDLSQ